MHNWKRSIGIILVLALMVLTVAACQTGQTTTQTQGTTQSGTTQTTAATTTKPTERVIKNIRWIGVDSEPNNMQAVLEAVNEKLLADGLDLAFKPEFIPRDIRDQKIVAMFNANEEADLIHIMENRTGSSQFIAQEIIIPIDEYLQTVGQDLVANIPDNVWAGCRVDGKTFTVPAFWKVGMYPGAGGETAFLEIDYMAVIDYNDGVLKMPETIDELISFMRWKKERDGADSYYWPVKRRNVALHRGFDTWPFYVDYGTEIIYMNQAGDIRPWFATDEFRQEAAFNRLMFEEDMIHPEYLSIPYEESERLRGNGLFLYGGWYTDEQNAERKELVLNGTYPEYYDAPILAPEKPLLQVLPVMNVNAVLATSRHPEAAVQFLNWLYADFDNHALLMYGIEGEHYTANLEEGTYLPIKDDTGKNLYEFPIWQMGFANLRLINASGGQNDPNYPKWLEREKRNQLSVPENIVAFPNIAFRFDTSKVAAEWANCIAEFQAVFYPIKFGMVSYEEGYEDAAKRMYDAGINTVIDEYIRQFEAYKKANNVSDDMIVVN